MHSTSNLDDDYLGSGKRLRYSIRKYGKDNFKREIIKMFDSREELVQGEIDLITEELLNEPLCMNLKTGGNGGICNEQHYYNFIHSDGPKNFALKLKNDAEFAKIHSDVSSKRMKNTHSKGKINYNTFEGKTHSEETKEKMSEKAKLRIGNKNSSFGTCWITKDNENKKIKKEELDLYINNGWSKGRKIK
jgi:hypothetical protein